MFYYTDDPLRDFDRWDAEQQSMLDKLPRCVDCGKAIKDDDLYDIGGDLFCEDCMIKNFRRSTDYYINE